MGQLADELADLLDLMRIEPGGGFVQNHHLGIVDQSLGQCHALPVALGQLANQLAVHRPQPAMLDHPGGALPQPPTAQTTGSTDEVEIGAHFHIRVER